MLWKLKRKATANTKLVVEPTVAELGLSWRESAEAQMLAEIPDEDFAAFKAGKTTKRNIRRQRQTQARGPASSSPTLLPATFLELLATAAGTRIVAAYLGQRCLRNLAGEVNALS